MKAPRTTTTHRASRAKEFREQQLRLRSKRKERDGILPRRRGSGIDVLPTQSPAQGW